MYVFEKIYKGDYKFCSDKFMVTHLQIAYNDDDKIEAVDSTNNCHEHF